MGLYNGMRKNRKAIVMSLCAAEKYGDIRKIVAEGPRQQEVVLGGYFRALLEKRRIRELDPGLVARQLIEMIFGLCMSSGLKRTSSADTEAVIRHFVEVLAEGIARREP